MQNEVFVMLFCFGVMLVIGWALGWLHCSSTRAKIRCPRCYFQWRPNSVLIEIENSKEPPVLR